MTHVIGTAGHVDHGKSSLVQALTGIDPDRLAEEKAREMTIDLGFAWLTLPDGEAVGIVDVPGHRDFIENMLAGIGGIDLALLVVAADEGIMPQTREHLAILDLLQIPAGVVALTKIDLVDDPEWLALVRADLAHFLQGTVLQNAPIIPVSARSGAGLDLLITAIQSALAVQPARPDTGRPRLPVDRVFSMSGFGTVVTGTLSGGRLSVGDEAEVSPRGLAARVRGLQSHKQAIQMASPGSRVAINLAGVGTEQVRRGDVVASPGLLTGTQLIDVRFRHHLDSPRALRHDTTLKFFSGAAETAAHVRLLGDRELPPGAEGWLQLRLDAPLALDRGDRFILRIPSPGQTIGGGVVLDAHPAHRWRRFRPDVLERFERLAHGTNTERLLDWLMARPAATVDQLAAEAGLDRDATQDATRQMIQAGAVIELGDGWLAAQDRWERLADEIGRELGKYHAAQPLRAGMPREALRSRLGIEAHAFNRLMALAAGRGLLAEEGALVRLPGHSVRFSAEQEANIAALEGLIAQNPTATPSISEARRMIGEDVLGALFEMGRLVQVGPEVLFDAGTYRRLVDEVRAFTARNGSITIAQARDVFQSSRKYATALLEHLDEIGLTRRAGDQHVLK